jgi:hypothetical protein
MASIMEILKTSRVFLSKIKEPQTSSFYKKHRTTNSEYLEKFAKYSNFNFICLICLCICYKHSYAFFLGNSSMGCQVLVIISNIQKN